MTYISDHLPITPTPAAHPSPAFQQRPRKEKRTRQTPAHQPQRWYNFPSKTENCSKTDISRSERIRGEINKKPDGQTDFWEYSERTSSRNLSLQIYPNTISRQTQKSLRRQKGKKKKKKPVENKQTNKTASNPQ